MTAKHVRCTPPESMLEVEGDTDEPMPLKQLMSDVALEVVGEETIEAVVDAVAGHRGGGVTTSVPAEMDSCPLVAHV